MRVGAIGMTVWMFAIAFAPSIPLIAAGLAVLGAGMGFGLPGHMAAPTLLATKDEQGAVAGLVGSTNALTFHARPASGHRPLRGGPHRPVSLG